MTTSVRWSSAANAWYEVSGTSAPAFGSDRLGDLLLEHRLHHGHPGRHFEAAYTDGAVAVARKFNRVARDGVTVSDIRIPHQRGGSLGATCHLLTASLHRTQCALGRRASSLADRVMRERFSTIALAETEGLDKERETCYCDGRRTTDDGRRTTDDGRRTTDDGASGGSQSGLGDQVAPGNVRIR
jgi:hypothetical protein